MGTAGSFNGWPAGRPSRLIKRHPPASVVNVKQPKPRSRASPRPARPTRYREEVVRVEIDEKLERAYGELEEAIKKALKEHRGNASVVSVGMNALLLYPDRPFGLGALYGSEINPDTGRRERFVIAEPEDLDESVLYAKERRLVEEIKSSLSRGRKVHVFAVYTRTRDVTRRLERILQREGVRVAVLTSYVKPELRESWYDRQSRQGVQVVIGHPKLVSLGLDLLEYCDLFFWETGYSLCL